MNLSFFAFPVNVALLLVLIGTTYVLYSEKRKSRVIQMFIAPWMSVLLIAAVLPTSLIIAFFPEWQFQQSWIFNILLIVLLANLQGVVMKYKGKHKIRFYLTHIGLYIFVASLAFGAPDTHKARAILSEGQTADRAYDLEGRPCSIQTPLKLEAFEVSYYDNKVPRSFQATVSIHQEKRVIRVNHPWSRSWKEDIYLVSHGTDPVTQQPYCVLEFISQPWKHLVQLGVILTALGVFLLLWGKNLNQKKS